MFIVEKIKYHFIKPIYFKCLNLFNKLKKSRYINVYTIAIILFALFMFYPFIFHYIYGDDTAFHYSNVFIRGSDWSYIFSKIVPVAANDLGYGIGIFYPMLPHVVGGIILNCINVLGFDTFVALKLIKLFIIIASGIFMYLFANKLFKNKLYSCITAIMYISSSYFYVDMYSRDALNESFVFMFIPLIFLGIYYLFNDNNKRMFYICFIGGYVGMMYSHLVMSVWFTLFFIIILLFFWRKIFNKSNFVSLLISAILILIFTAPFTVPLIEHLLEGGYVVFDTIYGTDLENLTLKQFFIKTPIITGGKNVLFVNFQLIVILLVIISVIKLIRSDIPKERRSFIIALLCFGILGVFFTCCDFIWKFVPSFLRNIQLPWRTCVFATFGICIFAAEGLDYFFKVFKKKYIPIVSILVLIVFAFSFYYNLKDVRLLYYKGFNVSNDSMGWKYEYLPSEAKSNLDYFKNRKSNKIIITKGSADVKILNNQVPSLDFEVKNVDSNITLELPRLYYLGYQICDDNGDKVSYYKNKNGFIAIDLSKNGKYYMSYTGTFADKLALVIALLSFIICLCVLGYSIYKNKSLERNKAI